MKVNIMANGVLAVDAESNFEAFALRAWAEKHPEAFASGDRAPIVFGWGSIVLASFDAADAGREKT